MARPIYALHRYRMRCRATALPSDVAGMRPSE